MKDRSCCVFCDCDIASKESFKEGTFERAAREIGLCDDCFEKITGEPKPANRIKWGAQVGKCPCCLTPIFTINVANNEVTCSTCAADLQHDGKHFKLKGRM